MYIANLIDYYFSRKLLKNIFLHINDKFKYIMKTLLQSDIFNILRACELYD